MAMPPRVPVAALMFLSCPSLPPVYAIPLIFVDICTVLSYSARLQCRLARVFASCVSRLMAGVQRKPFYVLLSSGTAGAVESDALGLVLAPEDDFQKTTTGDPVAFAVVRPQETLFTCSS